MPVDPAKTADILEALENGVPYSTARPDETLEACNTDFCGKTGSDQGRQYATTSVEDGKNSGSSSGGRRCS